MWSNPSSSAFTIVGEGKTPGGGFTMPIGSPMCCEDAVAIAGFDPFGCSSVALVSVPGAIVTLTPIGPVSPSGPITIPTTPPTVVLAMVTPPTGGTYLGCFVDTNSPYNLDGYLERSASNTPERCVNTCREKGFRFAGVEYGQSCLCGNSYDRYGPADNCDMQCTGDQSKICGGFNANSVYSTGL